MCVIKRSDSIVLLDRAVEADRDVFTLETLSICWAAECTRLDTTAPQSGAECLEDSWAPPGLQCTAEGWSSIFMEAKGGICCSSDRKAHSSTGSKASRQALHFSSDLSWPELLLEGALPLWGWHFSSPGVLPGHPSQTWQVSCLS